MAKQTKCDVVLVNSKGKVKVNKVPLSAESARALADGMKAGLPQGSSASYEVRERR
jgi:hypothetical protein